MPGLVAARQGSRIVLGNPPAAPFANSFSVPLSIPGEVEAAGWNVSADCPIGEPLQPLVARGHAVVVAAEALRHPLAVRSRRPGDRFKPIGMGGRGRKLQDFLVDRKIARADRDALPLVVDRDDRIIWVVGQSVAEDFRVTALERGVILLKARRLGGVG
jgi:tRNA(Ile)-lysidine synthase